MPLRGPPCWSYKLHSLFLSQRGSRGRAGEHFTVTSQWKAVWSELLFGLTGGYFVLQNPESFRPTLWFSSPYSDCEKTVVFFWWFLFLMKLQVIDSLVIKNNYFLSGVFWLLNQILWPLSQTILSITLFWFIWSKKTKKDFSPCDRGWIEIQFTQMWFLHFVLQEHMRPR